MKIQKHIEIVRSNKHDLSSMSHSSTLAIQKVLQKHYASVSISTVNTLTDLQAVVAKQPNLIIAGVKYIPGLLPGSKIWLAAYLSEHNIAFTGSTERAMKYEQNKPFAKQCLLDAGFNTSQYFVAREGLPINESNFSLTFPLFVKPASLGAGRGIDEQSVVHTISELRAKVASIFDTYHVEALIEEYLPGREFSVAVVRGINSGELLAMPVEIIAPADKQGNFFLSASVKHADSEKVVAVKDSELKKTLSTLAVEVFKALGSRDYGRIDIRLDKNGAPSFIEANLMPGLSNHGYMSRCFYMNEAVSYEAMILHIVSLGFDHPEIHGTDRLNAAITTIFDPNATMGVR